MQGEIFQAALSGLAVGSIYSLVAMGFFITFLTTKILNFGQGDFLAIGAFAGMALATSGFSWPIVLLGSVALCAAISVLLYFVAIRPLDRMPKTGDHVMAWILTTLAFGLILRNVVTLTWGKSIQYSPPLFSEPGDPAIRIFGAGIFVEEVAAAALSLIAMLVLYLLLFKSKLGRQLKTVAFDRDTAALMGIHVGRTVIVSFVTMGIFLALAGALIGPIISVQSTMGAPFLIKGFAVAVIAGLSNPIGILIAGLGLGVAETLANLFDSSYGDIYAFLGILLILAVFPQGLFGHRNSIAR